MSAQGERIAAAAVAIAGAARKGAGKMPGYKGCLAKKPTAAGFATFRYAKPLTKVPRWACCDCAATAAIRWSGADDSFPGGSWPSATMCARYLIKSPKWSYLGMFRVGRKADGSYDGKQKVKLQPGDVLVRKENYSYAKAHPTKPAYPKVSKSHIRIYVGREFANRRFKGCNCTYMEASHNKGWPHLSTYHSSDGDWYAVFRRNAKSYDPAKSKYAKNTDKFTRYLPKPTAKTAKPASKTTTAKAATAKTAKLAVTGKLDAATVKAWQRALHTTVTGKMDSATVKALQRYLNAHGAKLSVDGVFGRNTKKAAQRRLAKLGWYGGKIDGVFGPNSTKALQRALNAKAW